MAKTAVRGDLPPVRLQREGRMPLSRQIYAEIASAILAGRVVAGARLPSTRRLGTELGVARNTIVSAYDLLVAEGYVECGVGAGTRVAQIPPGVQTQRRTPALSRRGARATESTLAANRVEARGPGIGNPALEHFPRKTWKRLMARAADRPAMLGYGNAAGYGRLRALIAEYVCRTRSMRVTADHVVVVSGTQQALDLAARLLLDPGDRVLFEDPGYPGARAAFLVGEAAIHPVRVDGEGMDVARAMHVDARAAYVTPAHQFPTGATMSLSRRLALLAWAASRNAWIFEDDYDGEFRYAGEPLSALASLDKGGRVLYIGTFSKVLFPALRMGYMVMQPEIAARVASARGFVDRQSPVLEQQALAAFIEEGHFARHIRRMRGIYRARRAALVAALRKYGDGLVDVEVPDTGMNVVLRLPAGADDVAAAEASGAASSLIVMPLSSYAIRAPKPSGLVVGFARTSSGGMDAAARALMQAYARCIRSRPVGRAVAV